jgi:hypothetical protein
MQNNLYDILQNWQRCMTFDEVIEPVLLKGKEFVQTRM